MSTHAHTQTDAAPVAVSAPVIHPRSAARLQDQLAAARYIIAIQDRDYAVLTRICFWLALWGCAATLAAVFFAVI